MKCSKCGKEIANDSNFCEYCGTKVHKIISRKTVWWVLSVIIILSVIGFIYINATDAKVPVTEDEVIEEVVEEVSKPGTHVLQSGKSFSEISKEYYGTEDSIEAILRLNNITNPDDVPVGTVLLMP